MKAMKTTWFVGAAATLAVLGFIASPVARSQQGAAKQASPLDAHRTMIATLLVLVTTFGVSVPSQAWAAKKKPLMGWSTRMAVVW